MLWAITGTLDPVSNLTGLTSLSVSTNALTGMLTYTQGEIDECCFWMRIQDSGVMLWAITGTLDPVRNLTGLTSLSVSMNALTGMFCLCVRLLPWVVVELAHCIG